MRAPQIIMICIQAVGLGVAIARHGQARTAENAWIMLLAVCISTALLWWGGFWG